MLKPMPVRLKPGVDLRRQLEAVLMEQGGRAAFVVAGIGSLCELHLRLAGSALPAPPLLGDFEIVAMSGTVAINGSHVHAAVARADGSVVGGHIAYGCIVKTTAEVLLAFLPEWCFSREPDASTGYEELLVRRDGGSPS